MNSYQPGKMMDLLRKELRDRYDIKEAFLVESRDGKTLSASFHLTEECELCFPINISYSEEVMLNQFCLGLICTLNNHKLTSDILRKLLPIISFDQYSQLWKHRLESGIDEGIDKKIVNWRHARISGTNKAFVDIIGKSLCLVQEELYENHMDLFDLFVGAGPVISIVKKERKPLLFITVEKDEYKYIEFYHSRENRLLYYLHNKRDAFRVLFFQFWSEELFLLFSSLKKLELPELKREIFYYWFLLV